MNAPTPTPPVTVSFRHLLTDVVDEFLAGEQMSCPATTEALAELLVTLARYREEGAALFPSVFVCDEREALMRVLGGADALALGAGPRSAETMRRAIKTAAPLGNDGWSMYVERGAQGRMSYGVFRVDAFPLCESAMGTLRSVADPAARAVGVAPLAENVLELRGGTGAARFIHLSGARPEAMPLDALPGLVSAFARDVEPRVAPAVRTFFRRAMVEVLRAPHGSLVAVAPGGLERSACFADGLRLSPPVSVASAVRNYLDRGAEADRAAVEALWHLLRGMIGCDGITLLGSDGTILGYNLFVHPGMVDGGGPIGGARRRAYDALSGHVGGELLAAFYRSHDGATACRSVVPAGPFGR